MYKLIRFFNKNRKNIIITILIIVLMLFILQLLNNILENKQSENIVENTNKNYSNDLVSDKSLVSGGTVSSEKLETEVDIIRKFVKYCNNSDINSAYELLTDECKEEMFSTVDDFYNIYYLNIFGDGNKSYTVENWNKNTYDVKFTGDILSTGKLEGNETKQDYITIVQQDEDYKLNINNYIGRRELNKETEVRGINVNIIYKDIYMDYETYKISVKNSNKESILLGDVGNTKSIYLLDNNDMKYYFYNNEIPQSKLLIQGQNTNTLEIKFINSYTSSREIKNIVFSELIFDYEKYQETENKSEYEDIYKFKVNV